MAKLYNLARMTTATTGTGPVTLGSAVSGYLTFAQAGVADGDVVSYGIKDGANSEVGTGTYAASGTTLTRTVTRSTNSNAAIGLSGTAEVFITPRAEDFPFSYASLSNALGANVALNNTAAFFDGPVVAQGNVGTWFVAGSVTLFDTAAASTFYVKLWDGTTVLASTRATTSGAGGTGIVCVTLNGIITAPAGNLRISVQDQSSTNGFMNSNTSGLGKDSILYAFRIA